MCNRVCHSPSRISVGMTQLPDRAVAVVSAGIQDLLLQIFHLVGWPTLNSWYAVQNVVRLRREPRRREPSRVGTLGDRTIGSPSRKTVRSPSLVRVSAIVKMFTSQFSNLYFKLPGDNDASYHFLKFREIKMQLKNFPESQVSQVCKRKFYCQSTRFKPHPIFWQDREANPPQIPAFRLFPTVNSLDFNGCVNLTILKHNWNIIFN